MPRKSAIRKAAAPITGGMSWPPFEATASMAPATCGLKPVRFIIGMVMMPVDVTLATTLPEIDPKKPEASTAIFAAPPRCRPVSDFARSVKNSPPPVTNSNCPISMKAMTMVPTTASGVPNRAVLSRPRIGASR